jgi:hypothetical protein
MLYRSLVTVSVHQQNLPREYSKACHTMDTSSEDRRDLTQRSIVCWPLINLLPLSCDREIKDLTFFFKAMYGCYNLNVCDYESFVSHSRTRNCVNPSLMLKEYLCVKQVHSSYRTLVVSFHFGTICVELLNLQT